MELNVFAHNLIMNAYHGNTSMDKSAFIPKTLAHLVQNGRMANVFRLTTVLLGIMEKKIIVNLSLKNVYHQPLGIIINVKLQEEIVLLELIIKEEIVHLTHHVKMAKIGIIIY